VLLTAKANKDEIVKGLHAGADDYLRKPFNPLELQARLIAGQRILDVRGQLRAAQELLLQHATRDSLTGVWNNRNIMEVMEREVSRARRDGRPLGVILADVDHFKKIIDAYGHLAGDVVLREVAQRMNDAVRPYDFIGRYGGEQFLIVLPGCDEDGALTFGERVRQRLAEKPVVYGQHSILVTISLGAVVYAPPHPAEIPFVLHNADTALYQAKSAGGNRIQLGSLHD
jgi:diguanylate cyclase (GGDEF)-like protein